MNFNEYHKQLAAAPLSFRRRLREYLRRPTKRNACYITGYIAALEDAHLFKTKDAASYWTTLIGCAEDNDALGRELIAEMDNPPAGGAQAVALEAVREERDALKAENEKPRKALKDANDEVVFIDGVGAGRRSVESCRDGVQWIVVGDRVYWPLSDSDAKRLQSACCGNGHFDGPATPTSEGEQQ